MSKNIKRTLFVFLIVFVICGVIVIMNFSKAAIYHGTQTVKGKDYEAFIETDQDKFMMKVHYSDEKYFWGIAEGTYDKQGEILQFVVTETDVDWEFGEIGTFCYEKDGDELHLSGDAPAWMPEQMESITLKEYKERTDYGNPLED